MILRQRELLLLCSAIVLVNGIVNPNAEEKKQIWKDIDCGAKEGVVDWVQVRTELQNLTYPENLPVVHGVQQIFRAQGSGLFDIEARVCLLGLATVFFYLTQESLDQYEANPENERLLEQASYKFSVMDNYMSAVHPGLLALANWTVDDGMMYRLRTRIHNLVHRNLNESEHAIKIYVYEVEEVPLLAELIRGAAFCGRGQWGMESRIHDFFLSTSARTRNPAEADFFFVPGYGICILEGNVMTYDEIDEHYKKLIATLPYFNRSQGRNHVFTFGSGMSNLVFRSWRDHMPWSIILTPETELFNDIGWVVDPPFDTWKDIVIPGGLDLVEILDLAASAKPFHERENLASFIGTADVVRGPHPWVGGVDVRKEILQLSLENPDLVVKQSAQLHDMHKAMGNSKFCLIPRGKSAWSLRFFEALFANCIPVLLSDLWELPLEEFLDVRKFVIKWPMDRARELLLYLRSMKEEVITHYMEEGRRARCWYFYPPGRFDVRSQLNTVCPNSTENMYAAMLQLLTRRTQANWHCGHSCSFVHNGVAPQYFFGPVPDQAKFSSVFS